MMRTHRYVRRLAEPMGFLFASLLPFGSRQLPAILIAFALARTSESTPAAPSRLSPAGSPRTARMRKGRENFSGGASPPKTPENSKPWRVSLPALRIRANLGGTRVTRQDKRVRPRH